jgi:hypothetical protein
MAQWPSQIPIAAMTVVLAAGCASLLGMQEGEPEATTGGAGSGGEAGGTTTSTGGLGGSGGSAVCNPSDCPGQDSACQERACINNVCDVITANTGTECSEDGGHYCDGAGSCVECIAETHCGGDPCQDFHCVSPSCSDQLQNNGESDVDCGGPCGACINGKMCSSYTDCQSLVCNAGTCIPCTSHSNCPSGDWYCDPGSWSCEPKKALNKPCVESYECLSGLCTWWPITEYICSNQ